MTTFGRLVKRATASIRDAFLDLREFVSGSLLVLIMIALAGYFAFLIFESWNDILERVFR